MAENLLEFVARGEVCCGKEPVGYVCACRKGADHNRNQGHRIKV